MSDEEMVRTIPVPNGNHAWKKLASEETTGLGVYVT